MKRFAARICRDHRGFNLIEIVVSITVAAVLATILIQVMGTNVSRSAAPLQQLQQGLALRQVVEDLNADYKNLMITDATPLATFKTRVETDAYWSAGAFTATTKYIEFDGAGVENAAPCAVNCQVLKVTVTDPGGQSLTALFTR